MRKPGSFIVMLMLVTAACSGSDTTGTSFGSLGDTGSTVATSAATTSGTTAGNASDSGASTVATTGAAASSTTTTSTAAVRTERGACASTDGAEPLTPIESVTLTRIHEADGVTVDAALYPHPGYAGNPWSQWGQGIVAPTGRYYSAIGDHLGADGNSFIYEYDPATNQLHLIADVLASTEHTPGDWGYGKVHAQMALGPCDEVFFATYWGTRRGLTFTDGYRGDRLFHIDPYQQTIVDHGVVADQHGLPTMAGAPGLGLLYTIGVHPETNAGTFHVLDAATAEVIFSTPANPGFRSIAVDGEGAAWFSSAPSELSLYDPTTNAVTRSVEVPGQFLRAADTTTSGTVVGVMQRPNTIFTLAPDGTPATLGEAVGYTTSISLAGDDTFFYLPGAHGNSAEFGSALRAVDPATGSEREVLALGPILEEGLGVALGGTYNLVTDGDRIYLGVNVDPSGAGNGFGEVALLVITLP